MGDDRQLPSDMGWGQEDRSSPPPSRGTGFTWRRLAVLGGLVAWLALAAAATGMQGNGASPMHPKGGGLAGQLLVATEALSDPRFAHSVVYMIQHDGSGAMGLVINRPMGTAPLAKLLEELGLNSEGISRDIRVHYGGPVDPGRGFTLHTSDYAREGTQVVGDGIAVTVDPEILRDVGLGKGPRLAMLAVGYAGWAPGQLEAEIKAGAWIAAPADEALLFDEDFATKWERATARRMFNL